MIVDLLERKLAALGYEVAVARDGRDGLEAAKDFIPDLILLDVVMPRMGGLEMLAEMKKEPALFKIPVIIISNSGQPVELEKAKKLGAADWLVKTEFDPRQVSEKIEKILTDRRS